MYQHIIKVRLARPVNQRGQHARHANGQPCGLRRVMDQVVALAFMLPNEISKTCNRILYMYRTVSSKLKVNIYVLRCCYSWFYQIRTIFASSDPYTKQDFGHPGSGSGYFNFLVKKHCCGYGIWCLFDPRIRNTEKNYHTNLFIMFSEYFMTLS